MEKARRRCRRHCAHCCPHCPDPRRFPRRRRRRSPRCPSEASTSRLRCGRARLAAPSVRGRARRPDRGDARRSSTPPAVPRHLVDRARRRRTGRGRRAGPVLGGLSWRLRGLRALRRLLHEHQRRRRGRRVPANGRQPRPGRPGLPPTGDARPASVREQPQRRPASVQPPGEFAVCRHRRRGSRTERERPRLGQPARQADPHQSCGGERRASLPDPDTRTRSWDAPGATRSSPTGSVTLALCVRFRADRDRRRRPDELGGGRLVANGDARVATSAGPSTRETSSSIRGSPGRTRSPFRSTPTAMRAGHARSPVASWCATPS